MTREEEDVYKVNFFGVGRYHPDLLQNLVIRSPASGISCFRCPWSKKLVVGRVTGERAWSNKRVIRISVM